MLAILDGDPVKEYNDRSISAKAIERVNQALTLALLQTTYSQF